MINLTIFSSENPVMIDNEKYSQLVKKKGANGWTFCDSQMEWLCKLHYLRKGLKEQKLSPSDFADKERRLVVNWWYRYT